MSKTSEKLFEANNILYSTYTSGPYSLVSVMQPDPPELKALYEKLAENLLNCYQPLNFEATDRGEVIISTPDYSAPIYNLYQNKDNIEVKPFGHEDIIHIPHIQERPVPPYRVLLTPQIYPQQGTSFFMDENKLRIGLSKITAEYLEDGPRLFIDRAEPAEVCGELVAYDTEYITVLCGNAYRTFSLTDMNWNAAMNLLPEGLDVFWNKDRQAVILVGLQFLKNETVLILKKCHKAGDNTLELQVATLANPDLSFLLCLKLHEAHYTISRGTKVLMNGHLGTQKSLWRSL